MSVIIEGEDVYTDTLSTAEYLQDSYEVALEPCGTHMNCGGNCGSYCNCDCNCDQN